MFSGLRRTMSATSVGGAGGSSRTSPTHRSPPAGANDDVTQVRTRACVRACVVACVRSSGDFCACAADRSRLKTTVRGFFMIHPCCCAHRRPALAPALPALTYLAETHHAQELMSKIHTLMIENEEMKLKNTVLQSTVEALSSAPPPTAADNNHGQAGGSGHGNANANANANASANGNGNGNANGNDRPGSPTAMAETEWH